MSQKFEYYKSIYSLIIRKILIIIFLAMVISDSVNFQHLLQIMQIVHKYYEWFLQYLQYIGSWLKKTLNTSIPNLRAISTASYVSKIPS